MKKIIFILMIIASFSNTSCENDKNPTPNITTGIYGHIKYGMGDCMPTRGDVSGTYSNYNGELDFIIKADLEKLGNGDFVQLRANSIHTIITNGTLAMELPENIYLVMPKDVYLYSDSNTIIIKKGVALNFNFNFWKCTSY
jgi:hypothetical protein